MSNEDYVQPATALRNDIVEIEEKKTCEQWVTNWSRQYTNNSTTEGKEGKNDDEEKKENEG